MFVNENSCRASMNIHCSRVPLTVVRYLTESPSYDFEVKKSISINLPFTVENNFAHVDNFMTKNLLLNLHL